MRKTFVLVSLLSLLLVGCTGNADVTRPTPPWSTPSPDPSPPVVKVSLESLSVRAAHTATALPDGSVLVAGGCINDGCALATAETFLVWSDGKTVVRGPDLAGPRDGHTASSLPDGSVVFVAGYSGEGAPPLASIELFDARMGTIRSLGDLNQRRGGHASALVGQDNVLVVGGWVARRTYTSSAELVQTSSGSVIEVAPLPLALHAMDAITMSDGRVLVTGGQIEGGTGTDQAWIYEPSSDTWSETGGMHDRRFKHFSVLLGDGTVLVIGGTSDDREVLSTTEVYDPDSGSFSRGPDLVEPRYKLPGGAVVVGERSVIVGGGGRTVERIDLAEGTSTAVEDLGSQGSFATTTALGERHILVLGGYDRSIELRRRVLVMPGK